MRTILHIAFLFLLVSCVSAGCTPDDAEAPIWSDAPGDLTLGEGQTIRIALTADGGAGEPYEWSAEGSAGIEANVEADGRLAVHAGYGGGDAGSVNVVLADADGNEETYEVAVKVAPLTWIETRQWGSGEGPEPREHGSFIVDEEGGRVLLFGGSGYSPQTTPLNDLWEYAPGTGSWTEIQTAGELPAGGGSMRVAIVSAEKKAYLFGGYGKDSLPNNELWEVAFSEEKVRFTKIDGNAPPAPRFLHAFVYDAPGKRFIVFGGVSSALLDDVWEMRLAGGKAEWKKLDLDGGPTARYGFFYGYDEESRALVIFSGAQGTATIDPAQDTWVLDLAADPPVWSLVAQGEEDGVPPGRRNGSFVWDPSGPRLLIFGGTADGQTTEPGLWAFDARKGAYRWDRLEIEGEPEGRSSGFGFYDAVSGIAAMGFGNTKSAIFSDISRLGY
ncbi:MAG: kelch repeat-containing protein [Deltaproteobacteria bacterium]|nr:kelch repeat-containing protein [Deltaproteobacteria bacterium]